MRFYDFLKHFKGNLFKVMVYDKRDNMFKKGNLEDLLKEAEASFNALDGFASELWELEVDDWKVYSSNMICVKLSIEYKFEKEVAMDMVSKIDVELEKLEEELLKEHIENDPELKGKEISPELREQLLEEIREKCRNIEE